MILILGVAFLFWAASAFAIRNTAAFLKRAKPYVGKIVDIKWIHAGTVGDEAVAKAATVLFDTGYGSRESTVGIFAFGRHIGDLATILYDPTTDTACLNSTWQIWRVAVILGSCALFLTGLATLV